MSSRTWTMTRTENFEVSIGRREGDTEPMEVGLRIQLTLDGEVLDATLVMPPIVAVQLAAALVEAGDDCVKADRNRRRMS